MSRGDHRITPCGLCNLQPRDVLEACGGHGGQPPFRILRCHTPHCLRVEGEIDEVVDRWNNLNDRIRANAASHPNQTTKKKS